MKARNVFTPRSHPTTGKIGIKTNVEDLKRLEFVQQGRGITGQSTTLKLLMLLSVIENGMSAREA